MAEIPHFDFPFRRGTDGKVLVTEHGSPQHIRAQEYAVIVTPKGFRLDRPDFGWNWPEFAGTPLDLNPLRDALRLLVPDSDAHVEEWADVADAAVRHVLVIEEAPMIMPFNTEGD